MLAEHDPSVVVHLAADVGGIGYNLEHPARLYLSNLLMGTHVIEATRHAGSRQDRPGRHGVLVSEVHARSVRRGGPVERISGGDEAPYGIAKKAHLIHAQVNEHEYGQRFAYLIPTNLYGPGDKFHPSVSHVIPALIKKCVEAKESGADHVEVWGTGSASREYLYVDDAADRSCEPARSTPRPSRSTWRRPRGDDPRDRRDGGPPRRLQGRAALGPVQARRSAPPRRRRHTCSHAARLVTDDAVRARPSRDHRLVPRQPGRR